MKKVYLIIAVLAAVCLYPQIAYAQQTLEEATDSIKNVLAKAKAGDAAAQNEVGAWYYRGKHVKQNYAEAAQWWARSAKQGNARAIGNLGMCYETGHGVKRDSLRAVGLYNRSIKEGNDMLFQQNLQLADRGQTFYCVYIANCYKNGIGTKKDLNKAAGYFVKAARKGSVDAQRDLAMLLLNGKKPDQAFEWFKMGADQDDPTCVFYYGKLLHDGVGVKADPQQGMIYLLKAAEADFPMGQYEVAKAYNTGAGVMKNPEQGALWMMKAAHNGVSNAQYNLALDYVNGNGVAVDYDQATSWFALCIPRGHANAFKKLFEEGEGSLKGSAYHTYLKGLKYYNEKDFDNANKQFKIVAKAKVAEGKTMQGVILANKDYRKYNLKKGIKTLIKSAKADNTLATYLLGGIYEAGKGVDKDMTQASELLQKAAANHYAPALCYLGDMYYEGRGVPQDYSKAVEYYTQAQGLLTPNAAKRLAACYENGEGVMVNQAKAESILKKTNGSTADLLKLVPMN
ncbi:MAG: sel1 repeat family protein [Prevotellaceae bacterium]|jgi:TPR repeat protein|nr:sel1 repeat family protein [Prevotellaceae bacterium]